MAPYEQFVLFGDSLTQFSHNQEAGFASGAALQDAFVRRLDVINRGFSGYNTSQARVVLPQFMPTPAQAKIRFLYIFFGANDACLETSPSGQYVSLADYTANLEKLIQHPSVQAHKPHIFLINPPPINEYQLDVVEQAKGYTSLSRTAENTKQYADACREVGSKIGVPVVDLWAAFARKAGYEGGDEIPGSKKLKENEFLKSILSDGLHFLPPAYKILYEEVMTLIRKEWPDEDPEKVPMILPAWSEAPYA